MSIYINNLSIKNYKCFENENISFNVPDGTKGSGLNILIGENGNGKTAILESINYLTLNTYSAENKLEINDFNDFKKEILISAETDEFNCNSSIEFYKTYIFKANGFSFKAKSRDSKERGKLLSSPFAIQTFFETPNDQYIKKDGNTRDNIDGRDKMFSNARIDQGEEINIFFFDKNRTRQLTTGNYKTTFERICDDLNWTFTKNLNNENISQVIDSISCEYFKLIDKITNKNVGKKTASDLKDFFNKEEFENIRIDLLNLLHPFTNSFFTLRDEKKLNQINIRNLGSGIEIILTLLILKNIADVSKGNIIYLIDEPELHLHPSAQDKLLDLLLEESKNKQIVISTHSPYLFRGAISKNAKLILCTRSDNDQVVLSDAREKGWGLFPSWSPSWGEVNYYAYKMPTIEFHDELYGYLHEQYISKSKDAGEAKERSYQWKFEKEFLQVEIDSSKIWIPEFGGAPKQQEDVTLPTFIRNKIHHPENKTMQSEKFDENDLRSSIELMINIVKKS